MGSDHRVKQQGVYISQRGSGHNQLQAVHELHHCRAIGAFDFEAQDGSKESRGERLADHGGVRMVRIAAVMHLPDHGMGTKPLGECGGVLTLTLKAERERLDAAHSEVTFKRSESATDNT